MLIQRCRIEVISVFTEVERMIQYIRSCFRVRSGRLGWLHKA